MTEEHDARHEPLLAAVLTGELDLGDPAAAPLQTCPVCRDELARMHATTSLLDAAGVEQRAILADTADPRAPRRTPWLRIAAAALLAATLLVVPMQRCGDPARAPEPNLQMLLGGQEAVPGYSPSGAVARDAAFPFQWPADGQRLDPAYRVEVFELGTDGGRSTEPILQSPRLNETVWTPDEPDRARVLRCAAIEWKVYVKDAAAGDWEPLRSIVAGWR